jgi:hypothetical protein
MLRDSFRINVEVWIMKSEANMMLVAVIIGVGLFPVAALCQHSSKAVHAPDNPEAAYQHPDEQRKLMDALLEEVDREQLLRAVEHVESHGDPKAVSPKGAKGRYQLMDRTAKKPGLGVKPMQNRSQKEQRRFARAYLDALLKHYHGDVKLALAAYNGGVGRVDRVLAMMPKETREYVAKVQQYAENGE